MSSPAKPDNPTYSAPAALRQLERSFARRGLWAGLISAVAVLAVGSQGLLRGLDRLALDELFHLRGLRYPSQQILVVEADDFDVMHFGGWPLPRRLYGQVVDRLTADGARTIAMDVQFPQASGSPEDDRLFREACARSNRVIQACAFHAETRYEPTLPVTVPGNATRLERRFWITDRHADSLHATWGTAPRPVLQKTAVAVGHVNVFPELDGVLVHIPHLIAFGQGVYPSLALAAGAHFLGLTPSQIIGTRGEILFATPQGIIRRIPVNQDGETLINWVAGNRAFPTISFKELLSGQVPREEIDGRVVLVGIIAAGAFEHHATPLTPTQPAVELQANAVDDILMNRPLREASSKVQLMLLFVLPLLTGFLLAGRSSKFTLGGLFVILLGLWLAATVLLAQANYFVAIAPPFLATILTAILTLGYRQLHDAVELRRAEERYAMAVRGANDGLWDWNIRSGKVYYSPRWKSMLGLTEEAAGDSIEVWLGRVHPDEAETVRHDLAKHLAGDTPHFQSEHRAQHSDNSYRWVLSRGLAVPDNSGKPERMAGSLSDVTDRRLAEEQLLHNALHDALTGLPNRVLFMDRLGSALARAQRRTDYLFAVLFLDLDRFKNVNDSLGHLVGDQLLMEVGKRLKECLRPGDTAARLGGDEFTMLLDEIADVGDATRVAERIQAQLSAPFDLNGHEVFPTASIGIAISINNTDAAAYLQPEDLLRDADTAMYRAKALGRARHELFDEAMHARAVALLRLETDLRRALERQNFRVYYQPIVSLESGRIIGFEALARWQHPERGLVPPGEFIALAEETGLIIAIDHWVLREACSQIRAWQLRFGTQPPLTISVNLSGKQFGQKDLVHLVEQTVQDVGIDASQLKLEITESVIMNNPAAAAEMLRELKELGIRLSIDDFGTGYSSLSYLQSFPLDTLKVDRSFVARMGQDGENSEIVRTIITLARNLGMDVIAEGLETPEQLAQLRALGCDYGQGYFFAKPLDGEAAGSMLAHQPEW